MQNRMSDNGTTSNNNSQEIRDGKKVIVKNKAWPNMMGQIPTTFSPEGLPPKVFQSYVFEGADSGKLPQHSPQQHDAQTCVVAAVPSRPGSKTM